MARSTADQHWMDRAFALAENGRWNTAPNPRVGCVIVSGDQAIAEGWHAQWGGDHAEVDALKQLDASDPRLAEATAYVSLEPCNHHGRTPPCTELLIQRGIPRVVVGMQDPDPRVAGSGIERLRGAGIEVVVLNGQTSGRWLNRRFLSSLERGRPWVVLKCAVSPDGFADPPRKHQERGSLPITSAPLRKLTHQWRAEEQAILVGAGTVAMDDPRLDVREASGPAPFPVVMDPHGRTSPSAQVYQHPQAVVWGGHNTLPAHVVQLDTSDGPAIESVLKHLHHTGCRSVLVEGGPYTLNGFFQSGLWDEARWCMGPTPTGGGMPAPALPEGAILRGAHPYGEDHVRYFVNPHSADWVGHAPSPTLALPLPA